VASALKVGFALRSEVFHPATIQKAVSILDDLGVESVWFPDIAFDALELSAIALGATRKIKVGTGVIRIFEHSPEQLVKRVYTLNQASGKRFTLGVGTGARTGERAIEDFLKHYKQFVQIYPEKNELSVYFSALRKRMLNLALKEANGVIFNFCSPSYVSKLIGNAKRQNFVFAVYIKLFFAKQDSVASKMLIDEFLRYYSYPHYAAMFENMGVTKELESLKKGEISNVPESLLEISLYNPGKDALFSMLTRFLKVGINLPIIYPYVAGSTDYKLGVLSNLARSLVEG
jgi:Coenzyme F420-dependent N5,N10-methylene tetrahydromethanopterin reductase and related flavin-dependent oxidoreductases